MTSQSLTESIDAYGAAASARPLRRYPLRRRLPALIFALLGVLGAAFSAMAYSQVVGALRASGSERIAAAGAQVADLLAQSAAARLTDARRLATDAEIQHASTVGRGSREDTPPAAAQAFVRRNPLTTVWLYDRAGNLTGAVATGSQAPSGPDTSAPPSVPASGFSPLRSTGGRVWYHTTVPVKPADQGEAVGFLSVQRSIGSSQAADMIGRLIGSGAVLKIGNAESDVWTDLSGVVAAPPSTPPGHTNISRAQTGERHIGRSVAVTGTPWLVWIEVPERAILAPADTLLRRMLPIALALTVIGALAVYGFSARITKPLEHLSEAAEAIAAGDYTRRVAATGSDEIGRLGAAFNAMADRVAQSYDELEGRVRARTAELEDAREEMDQFFSLSLELLCIAGVDGRFQRVNPAWTTTLGWAEEDLTAKPYADLVHPDDRAATERESASLANGRTTISFENRYRAKDGSYRWFSWKAVPRSERGLIYAVAHDVTEQKLAERALHQHASDLANANRELEAFSYSVSHDLRTPLRSIDGFAQALVEDYTDRLDETGRDHLTRIRAAAQRMGLLIDDLLSLSRVSRAELTRAHVDATALVTEIATRLSEQNPGRMVTWRVEPGVVVHGDGRLLRIALDNLLGNAWKFTGNTAAPEIEFGSMRTREGQRALFVRDNGAGFDMAHATKLFGAFQRLHGVQEFPGTGIGLATVQRIVRRHGGHIWAEAAAGAGAAFFFTLEGS